MAHGVSGTARCGTARMVSAGQHAVVLRHCMLTVRAAVQLEERAGIVLIKHVMTTYGEMEV